MRRQAGIGGIAAFVTACLLASGSGIAGPPSVLASAVRADGGIGARLECQMSAEPRVRAGQAIRVRFVFRNLSDRPLHLLRWGNPFSPRQNGQFTITRGDGTRGDGTPGDGTRGDGTRGDGTPVPWSRAVAAATVDAPPTARSYKTIPAGGTSQATVSLTEGEGRYAIDEPGSYRIAWRGELRQVQDGNQPIPRPTSAADSVRVECNPIIVVVTENP
jgi:hypothetical protein